jgi:RNA polymerase sigma-70 factor (ECF subfamily)
MQEVMKVGTELSKVSFLGREALTAEIERALVDKAKSGSSDAFEQLVERYRARIFRVAYNITRHHEDAEDVMQNTFFKAFNKLLLFRGDSRFSTWLTSIAVNEALMGMRRHRHRLIEVSIDESREPADPRVAGCDFRSSLPDPEEYCSYSELHDVLTEVLNRLGPESRLVFQLRDIEGFSTRETAEALNLTVPSVKTRLHRARMTLRRSLDGFVRSQTCVQGCNVLHL